MSAQPSEQQSPEQPGKAPGPGMTIQAYGQSGHVYRGPALQQCPHCGAITASGATVCQECGEDLTRKSKEIRCRQCGHRAPAELVICPHCGRELKPAPSRLLTWGAPALLAILFLIVLFARGNPLPRWSQRLEKAATFVVGPADATAALSAVAIITPVPAEGNVGENPPTETVEVNAPAGASVADTPPSNQSAVAAALVPTATALAPTDTPQSTSTEAPTSTPTETPTLVATETPTARPTASPTARSTATAKAAGKPIIMPTATSIVKPTVKPTAVQPTATPTTKPALQLPTATPTQVTPQQVTYTVKPGDTLIAIAISFDVTTRALMDANDIDPAEVYAIRPGQELVIPGGTGGVISAPPPPAPTEGPAPTRSPTATPAPAKPAYRLDAPRLRSPEDGAAVSCQGTHTLTWEPVTYILDNDKYIMHLGFVSSRDETGKETVTWILNQASPPARTSWEMDNQLCALAPQDMGRQWRWYVEVVDQSSTSVSLPSETWGFSWK